MEGKRGRKEGRGGKAQDEGKYWKNSAELQNLNSIVNEDIFMFLDKVFNQPFYLEKVI